MTKQKLAPVISRFERYICVRRATVCRRLQPILSVSSVPEDHQSLRRILRDPRWSLSVAASCREAREHLTWHRTAIVICEGNLPDKGWKDLLHYADEYSEPLSLIVTSALPNKYLWRDVRNLGGYDVLPKPFDEQEVRGMLARAIHRRHQPISIVGRGNVTVVDTQE